MSLISNLKVKVSEANPSIVFPEGQDSRILSAAVRLKDDGVLNPIVLGKIEEIEQTAIENNLDISKLEICDLNSYGEIDALAEAFVERRKGKVDLETAYEMLKDTNYMGTLLVYTGKAEGMVSGAVGTTADTVRPALQIIKTKEGYKKTSGVFIMVRDDEQYLMADCAINIELDANDLAEIAILTDITGKQFGMDPKIAMLSYSSKGSASGEEVEKVAEATKIALERQLDLKIDGELQFDAAFVPTVAARKAPDSEIAGHANTFVFPNLAAGNIGYKLVQRFGGFEAVGPILQGLNQPVNDLSRGCDEDEVYALAIITAAQAIL